MKTGRGKGKEDFYSSNMGKSVLWSLLFHISIFIIASVSVPHFAREIEPMEMAVTVELADLAEIRQTNLLDKAQASDKKEDPAQRKPIYNSTDSVPDLLSPEIQEELDIPVPPKDKPKIDKSVIKNPPKPRNKPRNKLRKPKVAQPEKEIKDKPEDKKDFTSLLKSLTPDEPEQYEPPAPTPIDEGGQTSQRSDFSKQMTRSEIDDLNRGVQPCWNVNAGGKDAHNLIVELLVFVNQDRMVSNVQIMDKMRYSSNSHFKAAAEAARRALLNPRCSTLNLPVEKYERWKKFKYIFDPSQML